MRAVAQSPLRCTYSPQATQILPPCAIETTALSAIVALEEVPGCGPRRGHLTAVLDHHRGSDKSCRLAPEPGPTRRREPRQHSSAGIFGGGRWAGSAALTVHGTAVCYWSAPDLAPTASMALGEEYGGVNGFVGLLGVIGE